MIVCLDHSMIYKTFVPTSPLDPKMDVLNLASLLTTGTTIALSCMSNHLLKVQGGFTEIWLSLRLNTAK